LVRMVKVRGFRATNPSVRSDSTMAKRKSILPTAGPTKHPDWLWHNEGFRDRYPCLFEFLACGDFEGEERKGGSISLFTGQQRLKVCFLDKHTQLAFYAPVNGSDDLLAELEAILSGEHEAWQPVKGHSAKPVF